MALRKVLLASSVTPADNMASFTNVTGSRLHIRKSHLFSKPRGTLVALSNYFVELAERSTFVGLTNDSRALIDLIGMGIGDSVAFGLGVWNMASSKQAYNRGDLVLDSDESLFMNGSNTVGTQVANSGCNLFYETG